MIPIGWYLILSAVLFLIGVLGFFVKRNIIALLLSVEIMLNAVNLTLVTFARIQGKLDGQVLAFFVMVVAAAEVVVGLAIIVALYRRSHSADVDDASLLRW